LALLKAHGGISTVFSSPVVCKSIAWRVLTISLSTTAVDRTCPSCPFFFDDNNHSFFLTIVKD
jgi:hypothetical protein